MLSSDHFVVIFLWIGLIKKLPKLLGRSHSKKSDGFRFTTTNYFVGFLARNSMGLGSLLPWSISIPLFKIVNFESIHSLMLNLYGLWIRVGLCLLAWINFWWQLAGKIVFLIIQGSRFSLFRSCPCNFWIPLAWGGMLLLFGLRICGCSLVILLEMCRSGELKLVWMVGLGGFYVFDETPISKRAT